jgi:antitoxin component of MazEF toxin-antitoxin module
MHTTNLRKVGGSIMLAVPPALLDILRLRLGAKVGLASISTRNNSLTRLACLAAKARLRQIG